MDEARIATYPQKKPAPGRPPKDSNRPKPQGSPNALDKCPFSGSQLVPPPEGYHGSFWALPENIRYAEFLQEHLSVFLSPVSYRRRIKPNLLMSKHVGTRSSDQCRSHHQKMMKYHRSIPNIIAHVRELEARRKLHGPKETDKPEEVPEVPEVVPAIKQEEAQAVGEVKVEESVEVKREQQAEPIHYGPPEYPYYPYWPQMHMPYYPPPQ